MKINYWDCKYQDANEYPIYEDEYYWEYLCTHPKSKTGLCELDNKWGSAKCDCVLLDTPK